MKTSARLDETQCTQASWYSPIEVEIDSPTVRFLTHFIGALQLGVSTPLRIPPRWPVSATTKAAISATVK
jgi:hypothetical protein